MPERRGSLCRLRAGGCCILQVAIAYPHIRQEALCSRSPPPRHFRELLQRRSITHPNNIQRPGRPADRRNKVAGTYSSHNNSNIHHHSTNDSTLSLLCIAAAQHKHHAVAAIAIVIIVIIGIIIAAAMAPLRKGRTLRNKPNPMLAAAIAAQACRDAIREGLARGSPIPILVALIKEKHFDKRRINSTHMLKNCYT